MQPLHIFKFKDEYRADLVDLWERSVRATHHFLKPEDIDFYKSIVKDIDFHAFEVYCAFDNDNKMVGMLGVADGKLEMLFLSPDQIGKGVGRQLMEFVLKDLNVMLVDVNEGNTNAANFYQKFGFKVYDRTPTDEQGKPYPILKMKL